jgi:WD40 repeat protein
MELVLWDLHADPPSAHRLGGLPGATTAVAFSPDGRRALTLVQRARSYWNSRDLLLWELDGPRPAMRHLTAGGTIRTFAFSPDGTSVVAAASLGWGQDQCRLVEWDLRSPSLEPVPIGWPTLPVDVIAFAPDGADLLVSHGTNLLSWHRDEPQPRLVADMDDVCLAIGALRRADGGAGVVTVGRGGLVLWAV